MGCGLRLKISTRGEESDPCKVPVRAHSWLRESRIGCKEDPEREIIAPGEAKKKSFVAFGANQPNLSASAGRLGPIDLVWSSPPSVDILPHPTTVV